MTMTNMHFYQVYAMDLLHIILEDTVNGTLLVVKYMYGGRIWYFSNRQYHKLSG